MDRGLRWVLVLHLICSPVDTSADEGESTIGGIPIEVVLKYQYLGARFSWLSANDRGVFVPTVGQAEPQNGIPAFLFEQTCLTGTHPFPEVDVPFGIAFRNTLHDSHQLRRIRGMNNLIWLDLSGSGITSEGLKPIAQMKHLTHLSLEKTPVGDRGIEYLRGLEKLRVLNLSRTLVSDHGIERVRNLPGIEVLFVAESEITSAAFADLRDWDRLLVLEGIQPGQTLYNELSLCHQKGKLYLLRNSRGKLNRRVTSDDEIEIFELGEDSISFGGITFLIENLKNLSTLRIPSSHLSEKILSALRTRSSLHRLSIAEGVSGSRVTRDDDIVHLNLNSIEISEEECDSLINHLKNLTSLSLPSGLTENQILERLRFAQLKGIRSVHIDPELINDAIVRTLRELGLLHILSQATGRDGSRVHQDRDIILFNADRTTITHSGIMELRRLPSLKIRLTIPLTILNGELTTKKITGEDYAPILQIPSSNITDEILQNLEKADLLHCLSVARDKTKRPAVKAEDVVSLDLSGAKIGSDGIKCLKSLSNLRTLIIDRRRITDSVLVELNTIGLFHALSRASAISGQRPTHIDEIRSLDLFTADITDASIPLILQCKNVQSIDLQFTQISKEGLKRLKAALPNCEIVR